MWGLWLLVTWCGCHVVCAYKVRRGQYLVQDTLIQINRAKESDSLKKPLKVRCCGCLHGCLSCGCGTAQRSR